MFSVDRKPEALSLKLDGDLSQMAAYPSLDVYDRQPEDSGQKVGFVAQ